ncbi:MAG TPA: hypothetical protein VN578_22065 [Candidatus Binatia bacterium]|jgi:hypothetical protein|nr:hypothetical protein [Candidatus Binatia bacterium]
MSSWFWRLLCVAVITGSARAWSFSLIAYNAYGDNPAVTNPASWSTNAAQLQALGRQLIYLNPDVVTFVEIPQPYCYEMPDFVAAYLPGYYLATNSIGDGFLMSAVVSRYPITRSASYLHGTSLAPFGAAGHNFTRDLFEAQIALPGFSQPFHSFVTHLKASSDAVSMARRGAEAGAISNFFVTTFLPGTNGSHPYTLSGDFNEDINRSSNTNYPIQRLVNSATGLQLTTPVNPLTPPPNNDLTLDIQTTLTVRFDYILPCPLLFSNIAGSQVFRTDLLSPTPPGLLKFDDQTSSDHLPVIMNFNNPYNPPFHVLSVQVTNQTVALTWESSAGRQYVIYASADLASWSPLATNTATGPNLAFSTAATPGKRFFRIYRVP